MKKIFENLEEGEHIYNKYPNFKTESYRKRIFQFGYNQAIEEFEKMIDDVFDKDRISTYGDEIKWIKQDLRILKFRLNKLKSSLSKEKKI